jgi:hypothetical protein
MDDVLGTMARNVWETLLVMPWRSTPPKWKANNKERASCLCSVTIVGNAAPIREKNGFKNHSVQYLDPYIDRIIMHLWSRDSPSISHLLDQSYSIGTIAGNIQKWIFRLVLIPYCFYCDMSTYRNDIYEQHVLQKDWFYFSSIIPKSWAKKLISDGSDEHFT